MKQVNFFKYSSPYCLALLVLCLFQLSNSQPMLMTEDIGNLIFKENKYHLIYVYEEATPQILQLFNQHCLQRLDCAILNSTVEEYQTLRQFIGKKSNEFFLILNVPFHKKYVLEWYTDLITKNDLTNFQKRFHDQTLPPFYASQQIPINNSDICQELVGRTYDSFLKQPAVLKVIYTYTKNEKCESCQNMLQKFIQLSAALYKKDILAFGYVDVFVNDIPKIPEPIVPHFYIYQGHDIVKEVDEADFPQLQKIIKHEASRIVIDISQESSSDSSSSQSQSSL